MNTTNTTQIWRNPYDLPVAQGSQSQYEVSQGAQASQGSQAEELFRQQARGMQNAAAQNNYAPMMMAQALAAQQMPPFGFYGLTTASTLGWASVNYGFDSGMMGFRNRKALTPAFAFKVLRRLFRRDTPETLKTAITASAALAVQAKNNGQTALYEEMTVRIAEATFARKLIDAGFPTYLDKKAVARFVGRTGGGNDGLNLTDIENFGRPIPDGAAVLLEKARKSALFKGFTVMHAGMAMIKTTAQKIREKDPILFGVTAQYPDRLYVIADWVDEFCHLTLSELLVHPDFSGSLESVDVDESAIVAEAAERKSLLASANPSTWKENEAKAKSLETTNPTDPVKPWWVRAFFRPKK